MNTKNKEMLLKKYSVDKNGAIAIFGAGHYGNVVHKLLKLSGIEPDIFFDNNPNLRETSVNGVSCVFPEDFLAHKDSTLVIIAVKNNLNDRLIELRNKGYLNCVIQKDIENEFHEMITSLVNKNFVDYGVDMVSYMAITGNGSDKCLESGCFPMQVHYYQPVPDIKHLKKRDVWSKKSSLRGIKWKTDKFINLLRQVAHFLPQNYWSRTQTKSVMDFCLDNTSFSYVCASLLYGMICMNKPKRIIEIGSGNSSKVILKTLSDNTRQNIDYTIIDPYCSFTESDFKQYKVNIIKEPIEEASIELFEKLERNDILFIDSSHTVRIGGDVNFLILDVLPILSAGVSVHFHDIELPYEYSEVYFTQEKKMFWTEAYLLQAFLSHNDSYEIELPATYLCRERIDDVKKCYPDMSDPFDWQSSSFWIRKVTR